MSKLKSRQILRLKHQIVQRMQQQQLIHQVYINILKFLLYIAESTISHSLGTDTTVQESSAQESESSGDESGGGKVTNRKPSEHVNVQYTTRENLHIDAKESYTVTKSSTENIHVEDAAKIKPQTEEEDGEETNNNDDNDDDEDENNSVFEDDNNSPNDLQEKPNINQASSSENHEEVDDIELIFSAEDKDFAQEDLVSIGGDYEPWEKAGTSGTPVLVNFADIPSDQESQLNNRSVQTNNNCSRKMDDNDGGGFYDASFGARNTRYSLESSDSTEAATNKDDQMYASSSSGQVCTFLSFFYENVYLRTNLSLVVLFTERDFKRHYNKF